ncbi:MAG: SurA N-terminal domain-containing protein [Pseudomonadota bacterium]
MLQSLRKSAGGWLAKILLFFLVLSFAVWGINDIFTGYRGDTVIAVGDTEISGERLQLEVQQEVQFVSRQIGRPLTLQETRALGIDQQVIGRLVTEAVLDEAANRYGLGVSEEAIRQSIFDDPSFRIGNVFDRGTFAQYLQFTRQTEEQFVAERHDFLTRQIVGESIGGGGHVPDAITAGLADYETARRSASYFIIGPDAVEAVETPDTATLEAWYETQGGLFRAPEYREIGLIVLTRDVLIPEIEITEDDARAQYEAFIDRYSAPERRMVRQIIFSSLEEAEAARAAIEDGARFGDIATEQGLTDADTDLGTVTRDELLDPIVAEAAFALDLGEVSQPVEGQFGIVLVSVPQILAGGQVSFEQVEAQVRRELAESRAEDLVLALHDTIEDARAAGATLQEAARDHSLEYRVVSAVDAQGLTPGATEALPFDGAERVLLDLFESDVGLENDPVQLPDRQFAWYEVLNISAERDRSLDEVREEAIARYMTEDLGRRLDERARTEVDALAAGKPLAEVAADAGAQIRDSGPLTRDTESDALSPATIAALFSSAAGTPGWAPASDPDQRIVYVAQDLTPVDGAAADAQAEIQAGLEAEMANDLLALFVSGLQTDYEVVVNEDLLAQALGLAPRTGQHDGM